MLIRAARIAPATTRMVNDGASPQIRPGRPSQQMDREVFGLVASRGDVPSPEGL